MGVGTPHQVVVEFALVYITHMYIAMHIYTCLRVSISLPLKRLSGIDVRMHVNKEPSSRQIYLGHKTSKIC